MLSCSELKEATSSDVARDSSATALTFVIASESTTCDCSSVEIESLTVLSCVNESTHVIRYLFEDGVGFFNS